jgi:hypothetical protein
MLLRDWMELERYSDPRFASEINGVLIRKGLARFSARSVQNWRKGICLPRLQIIEAIEEFTKGQVLYKDHAEAVHQWKAKRAA